MSRTYQDVWACVFSVDEGYIFGGGGGQVGVRCLDGERGGWRLCFALAFHYP